MSFGQELKDFVAGFSAVSKIGMDWQKLDDDREYHKAIAEHYKAMDSKKDGAADAFERGKQDYFRRQGVPPGGDRANPDPTAGGGDAPGRTSSRMDPNEVRALARSEVESQGLVGYVPSDGARYGIKTGSADEWANLWTGLADHESGLRVADVGDQGQFPGGSRGLLQLSYADAPNYGLNGGKPFTAEQLADPKTNISSAIAIGKALLDKHGTIAGGLGSYWGPISKEGWTPGNGRDRNLPWKQWTVASSEAAAPTQAFSTGGLVADDEDESIAPRIDPRLDPPAGGVSDAGAAAAPVSAIPNTVPLPPRKPEPPSPVQRSAIPTHDAGGPQPAALRPGRVQLPDGRMATDAGNGLAIADDDTDGRYVSIGGGKPGGGIGMLGQALDGGMKFLQQHFALPQRGAIYDDGQRTAHTRFLSGEGAASLQEYQAVRKTVDPQGQLSDEVGSIAGLVDAYKYHLDRGDQPAAGRAAASLLQRARLVASELGDAALRAKTPEEATRIIEKAYGHIPDGRRVEVKRGPNGATVFMQTDIRTGKVVAQGEVTPQMLLSAARGLKDGSAFWQLVMQAAGEKDTSDPGADDYVRKVETPQAPPAPAPQAIPTPPAAPAPDTPAPTPPAPSAPAGQTSVVPAPAGPAPMDTPPAGQPTAPATQAPTARQGGIPAPQYQTPGAQRAPGMIERGNIDLNARPKVKNADGSVSTVLSMSFEEDGQEILVPSVSDDGRILTEQQAIDQYRRTGKFLGKFKDPDSATSYAEQLHQDQEKQYVAPPAGQPAAAPAAPAPSAQAIPAPDNDPRPEPPRLSLIRTKEGQERATTAYKLQDDAWQRRQAARDKLDPGADEYVRTAEAIPTADDPRPAPPRVGSIKTKEGMEKAEKAYKTRLEAWERRRDEKAPAAPPKLDDAGKISEQAKDGYHEWEASVAESDKSLAAIKPDERLNRISLLGRILPANTSTPAAELARVVHMLVGVDPKNPDRPSAQVVRKNPNGSSLVRTTDGTEVVLTRADMGALENLRAPKVAAALKAIKDAQETGSFWSGVKGGVDTIFAPSAPGPALAPSTFHVPTRSLGSTPGRATSPRAPTSPPPAHPVPTKALGSSPGRVSKVEPRQSAIPAPAPPRVRRQDYRGE